MARGTILYVLREERDRLRAYVALIDTKPNQEAYAQRRAESVDEAEFLEMLLRVGEDYLAQREQPSP
jgi:hypothetical protein